MKSITRTDIGLGRASNQDRVFASDTAVGALPNLYMVADGMGGQLAGEFASSYTVQEFIRVLSQMEKANPTQMMEQAAMLVNEGLYLESASEGPHKGTGTTLVAAVIQDQTLFAINVGDSRLYRIGGTIEQVTRDHSYAEELVRIGHMKRGTEEYLNSKHIITRAVGPWESIAVDTFEVPLAENDRVLLCSDGLSGFIPDDRILEIVESYDPLQSTSFDKCADALIQEAKKNGGSDNITFALVIPYLS